MNLAIEAGYQSPSFGRHKWWKNISKKRFTFSEGVYKDTSRVIKNGVKKTKTSFDNVAAGVVKDSKQVN